MKLYNQAQPLGSFSYRLHYCYMYNEVELPKCTVKLFGIDVPLTAKLCLN